MLSMHIVNEHNTCNTSLALKRNYVNDVIFKIYIVYTRSLLF